MGESDFRVLDNRLEGPGDARGVSIILRKEVVVGGARETDPMNGN